MRQKKIPQCKFDYGALHHSDFFQADMRGSSFRFANIGDANLRRSQLAETDFHHAILTRARLDSTILHRATMWFTNLTQAKLHRAKLLQADLRFANLELADLTGADLRWADLRGAHLKQIQYRNASRVGTKIDLQTVENANWDKETVKEWITAGAHLFEVHTPLEGLFSGLWIVFSKPHKRIEWWLTGLLQLLEINGNLRQVTPTKWVIESDLPLMELGHILASIGQNFTHPKIDDIQRLLHPNEWKEWQKFFASHQKISIWENGFQQRKWINSMALEKK